MVKAQDQYMQEVRSKWHLQLTFQLEVIQSKSLVTSCWKKLLLKFEGAGAAFNQWCYDS
jgi:hypothetical protein